jgi:hypothetical protein
MPNGINGRGSHTHSDKLSFVLRLGNSEVFCDSGTRCYTRDASLRNQYRSAAAHNVVVVDERDHNAISQDRQHLFYCGNEAAVTPIEVSAQYGAIVFSASHSGYSRFGILCTRTLHLKKDSLTVKDEIRGTGHHAIDLFYQVAPEWTVTSECSRGTRVGCTVQGARSVDLNCQSDRTLQLEFQSSEISRTYGAALPATRIRIRTAGELPTTLVTTIRWDR